jgi:hypothetical protein
MTPKEKAIELADKYGYMCLYGTNAFDNIRGYEAKPFIKKCALIAVDEIIESNPITFRLDNSIMSNKSYWYEVKKEIENL